MLANPSLEAGKSVSQKETVRKGGETSPQLEPETLMAALSEGQGSSTAFRSNSAALPSSIELAEIKSLSAVFLKESRALIPFQEMPQTLI